MGNLGFFFWGQGGCLKTIWLNFKFFVFQIFFFSFNFCLVKPGKGKKLPFFFYLLFFPLIKIFWENCWAPPARGPYIFFSLGFQGKLFLKKKHLRGPKGGHKKKLISLKKFK